MNDCGRMLALPSRRDRMLRRGEFGVAVSEQRHSIRSRLEGATRLTVRPKLQTAGGKRYGTIDDDSGDHKCA